MLIDGYIPMAGLSGKLIHNSLAMMTDGCCRYCRERAWFFHMSILETVSRNGVGNFCRPKKTKRKTENICLRFILHCVFLSASPFHFSSILCVFCWSLLVFPFDCLSFFVVSYNSFVSSSQSSLFIFLLFRSQCEQHQQFPFDAHENCSTYFIVKLLLSFDLRFVGMRSELEILSRSSR